MPSWHVYEWSSLSHDLSPSTSSKVDARSTIPFGKNIWLFALNFSDHNYWLHVPPPTLRPAKGGTTNAWWPCYDYQCYQLSVHSQNSSASRSYVDNMWPGLSKKNLLPGGGFPTVMSDIAFMEVIFQFWPKKKIIIVSKLLPYLLLKLGVLIKCLMYR